MKNILLLILVVILGCCSSDNSVEKEINTFVKINPRSCTTCFGKAKNLIDFDNSKIFFVFDESLSSRDAKYFISEMFGIETNSEDIIIADSVYNRLSRSKFTEIFQFKNGREIGYIDIDEKRNNRLQNLTSLDSINCDCPESTFFFGKNSSQLGELFFIADDRYPFYSVFNLKIRENYYVKLDSLSVKAFYQKLGSYSSSKWESYLESFDRLKTFNRAFPAIRTFMKRENEMFSTISIPNVTEEVVDGNKVRKLGFQNVISNWKEKDINELFSINMESADTVSVINTFGFFDEDHLVLPLINTNLTKVYLGKFEFQNKQYVFRDLEFLMDLERRPEKNSLVFPFYSNRFVFSNYYKNVYCTVEKEQLDIYKVLLNSHGQNAEISIQDIYSEDDILSITYSTEKGVFYYDKWVRSKDGVQGLIYRTHLDLIKNKKSRLFLTDQNKIQYIDNKNNLKVLTVL